MYQLLFKIVGKKDLIASFIVIFSPSTTNSNRYITEMIQTSNTIFNIFLLLLFLPLPHRNQAELIRKILFPRHPKYPNIIKITYCQFSVAVFILCTQSQLRPAAMTLPCTCAMTISTIPIIFNSSIPDCLFSMPCSSIFPPLMTITCLMPICSIRTIP